MPIYLPCFLHKINSDTLKKLDKISYTEARSPKPFPIIQSISYTLSTRVESPSLLEILASATFFGLEASIIMTYDEHEANANNTMIA